MIHGIALEKWHGAQNDFLLAWSSDLAETPPDEGLESLIVSACARHTGLGADGFIVLSPCAGALSQGVRMQFYNSDGCRASMCGNGARCAVASAWLRDEGHTGTISLETDAGRLLARVEAQAAATFQVELSLPDVMRWALEPTTGGMLIDTGVPHLVLETPAIEGEDLLAQAPALRHGVRPEDGGVNVTYFQLLGTGQTIQARTYERGVEGETLACGTGAVAAALSANLRHGLTPPITVRMRGGNLQVNFSPQINQNPITSVTLTGPAELIARCAYIL